MQLEANDAAAYTDVSASKETVMLKAASTNNKNKIAAAAIKHIPETAADKAAAITAKETVKLQ